MSAIQGTISTSFALSSTNSAPLSGQSLYNRGSGSTNTTQVANVAGSELFADDFLSVPVGGVSLAIPVSSQSSTQTVAVTAAELNKNIVKYTANNSFVAGQSVTVVGCTTSTFNVSAQPILYATSATFYVAVTHADIAPEAETTASASAPATSGGISVLYLRNLGGNNCILTWTGADSSTLTLPPQGQITLSLSGNDYSMATLSLSSPNSASLASAKITNDALALGVATYTTATAHGFGAGQLVTVTGLSNGGAFNVTAQPILSTPSPTTFTVAVSSANIASGSDSGDAVVANAGGTTVSYALLG